MDKLNELRIEINLLDEEIMALLEKRYTITNKIGALKKENNTKVLDSSREDYIFNKASKYSHSPQISTVYNTIMDESKKAQRK